MGNDGSSGGGNGRRRHGSSRRSHPPPPPPTPPQQEITANRYVFAAVTPYPTHFPNSNNPNHPPQYYQCPPGGYYPSAMPMPLPAPYDHHHPRAGGGGGHVEAGPWRYPCGPMVAPPPPYV